MLLGKLTVPNGASTHRRNNDDDSGDNRNIRTSSTHEHRLVPVSCVHVGVCMCVCMCVVYCLTHETVVDFTSASYIKVAARFLETRSLFVE